MKCAFFVTIFLVPFFILAENETAKPDVDGDLFYESFCSNSQLINEINLATWSRGTLLSGNLSTSCAITAPNDCKWILKIVTENDTETAEFDSLVITFDNFDISPIDVEDDFCDSNETSSTLMYFDEDSDDYPPCHFNHLNVSYFDELTGEKQDLIGQYCGDGWVPAITIKQWRSVIIEAHLTRPFKNFKIAFKRVMFADVINNQTMSNNIEVCGGDGTYFQCPDESKRCIPQTFQCDANVDCKSGADEAMCNSSELRAKQSKAAKSTDSGCGSDRYQAGISGTFSSEGFPRNYPNDARCIWYVTTAPGTKIVVQFHSTFMIDTGNAAIAEDCPFDSLTFYAQEGTNSATGEQRLTFLGRRCGQKAPNSFVTPGNSILVIFESDSAGTGSGFRLSWQAVTNERAQLLLGIREPPSDKFATTPSPMSSFKQAACSSHNGAILTSRHGTIRSPGFGVATYPRNYTCQWIIRPNLPGNETVKSVEIRFYDFNVQPSDQCKKDAVEVVFYDIDKKRRRGKYCDSNRPVVGEGLLAETNGDVHVFFRSDFDVQARGFQLGYYVSTQPSKPSGVQQQKKKPVRVRPFSMSDRCGVTGYQVPAYSEQLERIVGGQMTDPSSWPFAAELLFQGNHYCGATVLNEQWLITAAHCFRTGRRHKSGWQVVIGRQHIRSRAGWDQETAVVNPQIGEVLVHRGNGRDKNPKASDIALIKLREKINFDQSIAKPACLPSRDVKPGIDRCFIIGWGSTRGTGGEGYLKQAFVPVIENDECRRMNFYYSTTVMDNMICAGYQSGGTDACQGDSGGPLVCSVKGRWELHGIVSFGKGCAGANAPGVYTRVHSYMNWIEKVVKAFNSD